MTCAPTRPEPSPEIAETHATAALRGGALLAKSRDQIDTFDCDHTDVASAMADLLHALADLDPGMDPAEVLRQAGELYANDVNGTW